MTVYRCPACGTHEVAYGPLYYEGQRAKDHAVCLLCPWEGDMVQLSTKEGNGITHSSSCRPTTRRNHD
jgi:hypothetical protein